MIGIGRHTDYAARILIHLASLPAGQMVTVQEIAKSRLLPAPFVRRIIARLAADGLLKTVRGQRGGVKLARPAARITLLDLVRTMEGGISLNRCVDEPHTCPLAEQCPVQRAWTDATRELERHLSSVTFAELAAGQKPAPRAAAPESSRRHRSKRT
jgi:Rrf2 family protein